MTKLRTYLVRFDGQDRIVKAATPARAERHVLAVELAALRKKLEGEARVANGIEVADFVAGGGRIETEGEDPVPARAPLLESLAVGGRSIVEQYRCTCGTDPAADANAHDISCPMAIAGEPPAPEGEQ